MAFKRGDIIRNIKKIYIAMYSFYNFLHKHWLITFILLAILSSTIVWCTKTYSTSSLLASAINPVAKSLREGIIDTENQKILKAGSTIYIEAEIVSEDQGPIFFWNDKPEKRMLSIKNTGEKVISSTELEGSAYPISTKLKVSYIDNNGQIVDNFERDLREPIHKGDPKWQSIDLPLPKMMSGEIQVALSCKDEQGLCDTTKVEPLKRYFELRYDIKNTQTIIIDATFGVGIDNIEVEAFREKFNNTFNLNTEDSEKILRAMYSTEAVRENTLSGAIILANPAKYPTEGHVLIRTLENIIKQSYTHLSEKITFIPYDKGNFDSKTYLLKGCTVKVDCPNNLGFKNLDPYKNPFSKAIFEANPDLDFLIIIPAASDIKKND